MGTSRTLFITGTSLLLTTLVTTPSYSQSLKQQLDQKNSEQELKEKNCLVISQNSQYQRGDYSIYVDPNGNVHEHTSTSCREFIGNINKPTIKTDKCRSVYNGLTGYNSFVYQNVEEWDVEGSTLNRYRQTNTYDCQNNLIDKGSISTIVYKKYR